MSVTTPNEGNDQALPRWLAVKVGVEHCLLELSVMREIFPRPDIVPVAHTPKWMKGLTNLRGTLFSVVDFPAWVALHHPWFQCEQTTQSLTQLVSLSSRLGLRTALLVNSVLGLRQEADFLQASSDMGSPYFAKQYVDATGLTWHLLDMQKLFAHPDWLSQSFYAKTAV